jgi:hypothetical protein
MWTQEKVAALKQLRDAGHSAAEIAAVLGVSRSAVLAKSDRLNLPTPPSRKALQRMRLRSRLGQMAVDEG